LKRSRTAAVLTGGFEMSGKIHIGTSGWHYPHWKARFYPPNLRAGQLLDFYAARFDIVELNNTFYRLPAETAVKNWRDSSPPGFRFAVKGSRYLTHMKKLKDPALGLERFFARVDLLGPKLGPILFQLPPNWDLNVERFGEFLKALPTEHRYAFEFRNPGWNVPEIEELLRKFHAAYCIFDLAGYQSPLTVTTNLTYVRLHGPGEKYQGSYLDSTLQSWAARLREWNLDEAYVFFDNDQAAYAIDNALQLKELMGA
jgi:uncharacterized protein YecE (DUF72 family)